MMSRVAMIGLAIVAGTSTASCKTYPSGDMTPAALASTDPSSMTAVKTAAAEVLGRKTVELGASELTRSPTVSVLPERAFSPIGAPYNQQSFVIPTRLLLMTDGKNCFLVNEDNRKLAHVKDVACRSLGQMPP